MNKRKLTKTILLTTFMLSFILVLVQQTQAAPRAATPLVEGRTYDQAHSVGKIDWSGSVSYTNIYHRSNTIKSVDEGGQSCGSGCTEPVTHISSGSYVSGSFLRDVTYFETMAAYEWVGDGVGRVTVSACGSSGSWSLQKPNNNTPGFNSFAISVPAGCRTWSVRASSGHVHIRSVDAYYVPATATPSPTITASPTWTFTPTITLTFTSTATYTPTNTATSTSTPTFTPSPTATYTFTFTPTSTATETYTPTPTFTFTATASNTPTNIPRPKKTATRIIQIEPTSTETATGTPTKTQSPTATITSMPPATTTPTATMVVLPTSTPQPPIAPKPQPKRFSPIWPALLALGLLIIFATNSLIDPRPKALTRLGEIMDRLSKY